jgi:flagellar basal body rod protein FlgG
MIKGLYAAVSAMMAGVAQQQVLSHNVANLETPGFKQIMKSLDDFVQTAVPSTSGLRGSMSGISAGASIYSLGSIGLGVEVSPDQTDYNQGGIISSDNPLDLAISGNGFFRLRTADGERYTRDGRFLKDASGQLVSVAGFPVLSQGGQPIVLPEGLVSISPDGTVMVNNQAVGQIGLAGFQDPEAELVRDDNNTFQAAGAPTDIAVGTIQQNALEMSNANPTQLMTQMVEAARFYQAAQQMVQNQDEMLGAAINTLGRIG